MKFFKKKQYTDYNTLHNLTRENPLDKIKFNTEQRFFFEVENLSNFDPDFRKHLIWLGTCHYDGYERERYLKLLFEDLEFSDINRILMRLLDWVPAIQAVADKWLLENYKLFTVEHYLENIPLMVKIKNREVGRVLESPSLIDKYIWDELVSNAKKFISSLNSMQRRYIYSIRIDKDTNLTYELLKADKDPNNRILVFENRFRKIFLDDLDHFKKDKSDRIRRYIFYKIYLSDSDKHEKYIIDSLTDRSSSIRSAAQYFANKHFNIDARQHYLENFKNHDDFLIFLSDLPRDEDVGYFENGLNAENNKILLASIYGFIRLKKIDLIKNDLFQFLNRNKKIGNIVQEAIQNNCTSAEIINHKQSFIEADRIHSFLSILLNKSFFVCLNEALKLIVEDYNKYKKVVDFIENYLFKKVNVYVKCHDDLKQEISHNMKLLSDELNSRQWDRQIGLLLKD